MQKQEEAATVLERAKKRREDELIARAEALKKKHEDVDKNVKTMQVRAMRALRVAVFNRCACVRLSIQIGKLAQSGSRAHASRARQVIINGEAPF